MKFAVLFFMLIDSCAVCGCLTWKKEAICKICVEALQKKELLYRQQNGLDIFSLLLYNQGSKKIIKKCKQGQEPLLIKKLVCALLTEFCKKLNSEINGVIPIPASLPGGQDHAYLIAKAVANETGATVFSDFLVRSEQGKQQKDKSLMERKNIRFTSPKSLPRSASGVWILVDDVITTGMTLSEAHITLGRPEVLCLTLATRPYDKGIYE